MWVKGRPGGRRGAGWARRCEARAGFSLREAAAAGVCVRAKRPAVHKGEAKGLSVFIINSAFS